MVHRLNFDLGLHQLAAVVDGSGSEDYCSPKCSHPLYVLTNNWTRSKQPVNIPPPQSITPGLHPVSIHEMAPPEQTSNCSSLLSTFLSVHTAQCPLRKTEILLKLKNKNIKTDH